MNYKIFRNSEGKVDALNRELDGATVPFWDETHELTIELRQWEAENGALDLNDTQPDPTPLVKSINWDQIAIQLYRSNLYRVSLREATAGASPEYTDKLWWIDKDITTVLVEWKSDEPQRIYVFNSAMIQLFQTLIDAGFPASEADRIEIVSILNSNGFAAIAESLPTE